MAQAPRQIVGLLQAYEQEFLDVLHKALPPTADFPSIHKGFTTYQQLLNSWNQKFNLVSEKDLEKVWSRHFLDSLIALELFPELVLTAACDVGSGAGFPGLALAIARPEMKLTLMESNGKKSSFLNEVISNLKLNCRVATERAEVLGQDPSLRETKDAAFTRALAKAGEALELVLPFLKIGGKAVFWAGGEGWEDLNKIEKAAKILSCEVRDQKFYALPGEDGRQRKLVLVEKVRALDPQYPRRTGVPHKKPLC